MRAYHLIHRRYDTSAKSDVPGILQTSVAGEIACPSCGSNKVVCQGKIAPSNTFAGRMVEHELDGGSLYKCSLCSLGFRYPRMSKLSLDQLYRQGNVESWATPEAKRTDWLLVKKWLAEHNSVKRILDVGCFDGRFLEFLGNHYDRLGVEIHREAAERARARGIQVLGDDFDSLSSLNVAGDAVLALDVIEHSSDPRSFLADLASCVRSGGFIVISTGNSDAPTWRLMGSRYWYCHIAEHLSFINPSWIERAAPLLGLQVVSLSFFSHAGRQASFRQKAYETAANLILRFAPGLFALLRRSGAGGVDLVRYPGLALVPPYWMSAKDHMLVVLKKVRA